MATSHRGVDSIATIPSSVQARLRETMVLGLPAPDAEKPTFYFARQVSWADFDAEGHPWDWTAAPALDETPDPVQPICAYEFFSPLGRAGSHFSEVGDFFPSTLIVTFTETDFPEVVDSSYATVGPSNTRFWFRYYRPSLGLGGLTFYQVHLQAEDTE